MKLDLLTVDVLTQVLEITNSNDVKHLKLNAHQNLLCVFKNIIKITQDKWLRPPGKERWDLKDSPLFIERRNDIIKLLSMLGFIDEVKPTLRTYDCVLLLGASDINLIKRVRYLNKHWDAGIRYKRVYLLTGGVRIKHDLQNADNILSNNNAELKTDTKLIMDTYKKNHSDDWEEVEIIPVVAAKKRGRPNTEDTLTSWLEKNEESKIILVISNQPFVRYQDWVVKRVLAPLFWTETVGDAIDTSVPIAVILDSAARCLYELSLSLDI